MDHRPWAGGGPAGDTRPPWQARAAASCHIRLTPERARWSMEPAPPAPPTETTFYDDLRAISPPLADTGVGTLPLFKGPAGRVSLMRFAAGEGMAEHVSPHAAVLQVVEGRLRVRVLESLYELVPGGWLAIAPGDTHALDAPEPATLLLTLLVGP